MTAGGMGVTLYPTRYTCECFDENCGDQHGCDFCKKPGIGFIYASEDGDDQHHVCEAHASVVHVVRLLGSRRVKGRVSA